MTAREAISQVRSAFRINSADSNLTDRAILGQLNGVRNTYLKQQADKRKLWESPNIFTPLKVTLEPVRMADYAEFQSDCMVARSTTRLPEILETGSFGLLCSGLYTLDRKRRFMEMSAARYVNMQRLGLPGGIIYYWIFDGYLWLSDSNLESVILPAFTIGPVPNEFKLDCEESASKCMDNPLDDSWRCPGYLTESVIRATADFYNKTYKQSRQDTSTDDKDDSK